MARRKLENRADFERALRNGYGTGVGDFYVPWIRVQDISSNGRSTKLPGILVGREHHLLSDLEKRFFLIAEHWLGVSEIREQFPLMPLSLALQIAEQAGIRYPKHPKSKEPIILTTDFLVSIETLAGTEYCAFAVKPAAKLARIRVREKLELERLWWRLLGIKWYLISEPQLDRQVADNLDWLSDPLRGRKRADLEAELPFNARALAASILSPGRFTLESLAEILAQKLDRSPLLCARLLRAMAWEHILEIDLTVPMQRQGLVRIHRVNKLSDDSQSNAAAS